MSAKHFFCFSSKNNRMEKAYKIKILFPKTNPLQVPKCLHSVIKHIQGYCYAYACNTSWTLYPCTHKYPCSQRQNKRNDISITSLYWIQAQPYIIHIERNEFSAKPIRCSLPSIRKQSVWCQNNRCQIEKRKNGKYSIYHKKYFFTLIWEHIWHN